MARCNHSRRSGVRVRTNGRAREDGANGELITVESIDDRATTFVARVTGPQEVDVFAQAAGLSESANSIPKPVAARAAGTTR